MMKSNNIRIFLIEDYDIVRKALRHLLDPVIDLDVVGDTADYKNVLEKIKSLSPDIVLMDIKMRGIDGIELTGKIKRSYPQCKIVMFTMFHQFLVQAMKAGASGYLLKDITQEELVDTIRKVHRGETVIHHDVLVSAENSAYIVSAYGANGELT